MLIISKASFQDGSSHTRLDTALAMYQCSWDDVVVSNYISKSNVQVWCLYYEVCTARCLLLPPAKDRYWRTRVTPIEVLTPHIPLSPQINLYLLSRITSGLAKVAVKHGYLPAPSFDVFPWFAALMWGIVLCLFEYEKDTLQPSLQNSMTYLYHDSSVWHNVWDLLVYNSNVLW